MGDRYLILLALLAAGAAVLIIVFLFRKGGVSHKPDRSELYRNVSEALVEGDVTQALRLLRRIALEYSDDWNSQLLLGDLLRSSGRAQKALPLHQMLVTQVPGDRQSMVRIFESVARDNLALALPEKALDAAHEMLELDRQNTTAHEISWRAYDSQGEWEAAWDELQRFYKRAEVIPGGVPSPALYKVFMGHKSLESGDLKNAQQHLRLALRLDPELHLAKVFLGDTKSRGGHENEAIDLWKDFAKHRPDDAELVFGRLERTLFALGRFGELNAVYEDILGDDAEHPGALAALARMCIKRGMYEEADRYLQLLHEKFPEDRRGRRLLVESLLSAGKTAEALEYMETWMEENPTLQTQCTSCGYRGSDLLIRCPQCNAWQHAPSAPSIR
ncbi:MAG: tetratricopeptide repeat protein [Candidatus Eisenbacteria bacterium]|uniref:Tetratricopeptide repeat protein n=1 Tax=Eiseniibacteriota bacterium TaxID=2212470 RepID=A0A948W6K4_UNCEI|nr:tetratricopeptide repeat protein [Candidatus Eisenbacteria bacterium]MBU1947155.1 tetratricopeptide repeat protein [Candidatus Eisenbacteria bacterium]MBU2691225.1 tetratricopeptide repeat protein [Candidatus Eisenbacteria bacterium]